MHLSDCILERTTRWCALQCNGFAHRLRVDVVVVSGDLTQRATRQQFALAHDFVCGLGWMSAWCWPGGHDLPCLPGGCVGAAPTKGLHHSLEPSWNPSGRWGRSGLWVWATRPWRHERGTLSAAGGAGGGRLAVCARAGMAHRSQSPPVGGSQCGRSIPPARGANAAVQRWRDAGATCYSQAMCHPALLQPAGFVVHAGRHDRVATARQWATQWSGGVADAVRPTGSLGRQYPIVCSTLGF